MTTGRNHRDLDRTLDHLRDHTAASPAAVHRVQTRAIADLEAADELLSSLTVDVSSEAVARVRRRVMTSTRPRWRWQLPTLGLALATAAALFVLRPEVDLPAQPLGSHSTVQLTPEVLLELDGSGRSQGRRMAPRIRWEEGSLHASVTPERGVDLVIQTPEARVAVVGTIFDVHRDALGTRVTVERGAVQVSCVSGGEHLLEQGDQRTCWPTTPGALLGRAGALIDGGAEPERVTETLALALPSARGPVRGELLALSVETNLRTGDLDAAHTGVLTYLAEDHAPRRDELSQLRMRLEQRLCASGRTDLCPEENP